MVILTTMKMILMMMMLRYSQFQIQDNFEIEIFIKFFFNIIVVAVLTNQLKGKINAPKRTRTHRDIQGNTNNINNNNNLNQTKLTKKKTMNFSLAISNGINGKPKR